MSLNTEGVTCVRCHAYLFPEDDVVYCPVCGAPHHRECYNELGHCALEEFHGTDKQYDRAAEEKNRENAFNPDAAGTGGEAEGQITCGMCHEKYDFSLNACPKCGAPNIAKAGGSFVNFDFLGGVPSDYDIGDTVTADEAKRFVAANTPRYIPKFATLNKKNRVSWNWAAFLFPCGWMLSRKMYKNGIILGLLTVISTLLYLPFNNAVYKFGFAEGTATTAEAINNIYSHISEIGPLVIAVAAIGFLMNIAIRVFSALFGDYFYKEYTISSVKWIRAESEDTDADYRRLGGVNIFLFFAGVLAVQYLPAFIAVFI